MFARFIDLKKASAMFLAFLVLINVLSIPVAFAADPVAVAAWEYTAVPAGPSVPATSGALSAGAALTNFKNVTPTYSTSSLCVTDWTNGANAAYWQLALSTKGYENLTLSARTRSSGTGPRDFKVIYSKDDGTTWADVPGGNYAVTGTGLSNYMPAVALPAEAANASSLLIRFIMASNISSRAGTGAYSPSETVASTGTSNINNIAVTGTPVQSADAVGEVSAAPSGGAVAVGATVALSCATDGATIMYSINDAAYVPYDPGAPVTLAALPATLKAFGTKSGMTDGIVTAWNFTQAQAAAVTASPNGGAVNANSRVTLSCETPGSVIRYSMDGGATWSDYTADIILAALPATIQAYATADGMADSAKATFSFTEKTGAYNLYFGQLHSHTTVSDGIGSLDDAFGYAKNTAHVDFLAVTDHSNSFDNASAATMADGSASTEWVAGHTAADKYTDGTFVGIYAFEMTWSNGTGHINTFNTPGFETRETQKYKNADGLQQYYNVLKQFPDSISQFNHPGSTFGDFNDFANYDPAIDRLITLVEVGNGEGAVRGTGYFPSYEYYTRALDRGWHLAPTNNQDNHLGHWGNSNAARTVVLADSLTRDGIYDAMRNMRVYATEDSDLRIKYTLNGEAMGSILSAKPGSVDIKVDLEDPDNEALGKVSVIADGGRVVAAEELSTSKDTVEFSLDPDYSYYYIRIDEADHDIAVTAPVWIGEVDKAGIAFTTSGTALPMKGQPLSITTNLYNNEAYPMNVTGLTYSVGGAVIHTAGAVAPVASLGTGSYTFSYTPDAAGKINVDVMLTATINGVERTFTDVLKLNVVDPAVTTRIVVDASHYNDYVTGYYAGNMTNLVAIANAEGINVIIQTEPLTDDALKDAQLLILSPPAKKSGTAGGISYTASPYTDADIAVIKNFADRGGTIIVTALADYQDSRTDTTNHSANQQNRVLAAIGAGTRFNDDEVVDYDNNPNVNPPGVAGGTPYRAPMSAYNTASPYLDGVIPSQSYSFYSGCSMTVGGGAAWLVKGTPTAYGFDSDNDGAGGSYVAAANRTIPADTGIGKGNVVGLAAETLPGGGMLFVGGTVFYSNFEVKTQLDNYSQTQNSNYNILINILDSVKKAVSTTTIGQARAGRAGDLYCVEGIVTAGRTPADNAFFDTIYIQDETGGINVYPVSGSDIRVGQKVKVTGTLDWYQGDLELRAIEAAVTDGALNPASPTVLATKDAMDAGNGGLLVRTEGLVTRMDGQNLYIDDGSGEARIFVDGYIGDGSGDAAKRGKWDPEIKAGDKVSAIGLASVDPAGPRLRVRNTAEIVRIFVPVPVGISFEKTDAALYGEASGSITLTATGGNSGKYKYSIDGGVTWQDTGHFGGVAAGTYSAAVCDAEHMDNMAVASVTVGQPALAGSYPANRLPAKANVGTAIIITAPPAPKHCTLRSMSFASSKPGVASVSQSGTVTFLTGGDVRITVTLVYQTTDGKGRTTTLTTKIVAPIRVCQPVSSIELNRTSVSITRTKSVKLIATVNPAAAGNKKVKWTSSNPRVALVSGSGVVTGRSLGTAIITCRALDGSNVSASCTVTVTPIHPSRIALSRTSMKISAGHTAKLAAIVLPGNADDKTVTWTSSDTSIVTVDGRGKVKAVAHGTATITATAENGLTATCRVTVT